MAKDETRPATTPESKKTRAPRTPRTKTFADHFGALAETLELMTPVDRDRAFSALRALYPHQTTSA